MSNIMSVELTEWSQLASLIDSPVAANLVVILQSLAKMSDSELLEAKITTKVTLWNSLRHGYSEAMQLPEGCLVANGFQLDVLPETVKHAVATLQQNPNGSFWEASSQAEIIRKAYPDIYR